MGHVLRNEGVSAVLQCVGDEAVYYVQLYAHLLCWTWTQPSVTHLSDHYFWCWTLLKCMQTSILCNPCASDSVSLLYVIYGNLHEHRSEH
jgi:hypothetical protein